MIPKVIHYCWFGRNPLPKSALKCIDSWRKFFPDYEIKEWNEDNFDVNIIKYTQDAYNAKKYAFVSDYARIWILYNYGGVYFDTDVEVISPMTDIIEKGPFMGFEIDPQNNIQYAVAPGLGIATTKHHEIYKDILDIYSNLKFWNGSKINLYAIVRITTDILTINGLKNVDGAQTVNGITIYPSDFFNPLDSLTGRLNKTANTRTIHWYDNSWSSPVSRLKTKIGKLIRRILS